MLVVLVVLCQTRAWLWSETAPAMQSAWQAVPPKRARAPWPAAAPAATIVPTPAVLRVPETRRTPIPRVTERRGRNNETPYQWTKQHLLGDYSSSSFLSVDAGTRGVIQGGFWESGTPRNFKFGLCTVHNNILYIRGGGGVLHFYRL